MAWGWKKELMTMETYKKQKSLPISLRLFLIIINVDLKNNNRNYRKSL